MAAADEFVGVTQRATSRYALVCRSVDHRTLKEVFGEAQKPTPPARYVPYLPVGGFDTHIQTFAMAVIELQLARHLADYDPLPRLRTSDAELAIGTARSAIRGFLAAGDEHRKAFLTLLVCPPR